MYVVTKNNAKRRNIFFGLTRQQLFELIEQKCHYCDRLPNNMMKSTNGSNVALLYSGIDRIDPSKGYVEGNVNPCCSECNSIRSDLPLPRFYTHIETMLANRGV